MWPGLVRVQIHIAGSSNYSCVLNNLPMDHCEKRQQNEFVCNLYLNEMDKLQNVVRCVTEWKNGCHKEGEEAACHKNGEWVFIWALTKIQNNTIHVCVGWWRCGQVLAIKKKREKKKKLFFYEKKMLFLWMAERHMIFFYIQSFFAKQNHGFIIIILFFIQPLQNAHIRIKMLNWLILIAYIEKETFWLGPNMSPRFRGKKKRRNIAMFVMQ